MEKKYKDFENRKLSKMVIEIDITKCDLSFRQLSTLISSIEKKDLKDKKVEISDIYYK